MWIDTAVNTDTSLNFELLILMAEVMAEANVNIADEFEIGEEEMAVFLLH